MIRRDTWTTGMAPYNRRQHGDRVPVSEPWMPPNDGTPWLQGERRAQGGEVGSRYARLAPLKPLNCALRASARRDAFLVLPPHLEIMNRLGNRWCESGKAIVRPKRAHLVTRVW